MQNIEDILLQFKDATFEIFTPFGNEDAAQILYDVLRAEEERDIRSVKDLAPRQPKNESQS